MKANRSRAFRHVDREQQRERRRDAERLRRLERRPKPKRKKADRG